MAPSTTDDINRERRRLEAQVEMARSARHAARALELKLTERLMVLTIAGILREHPKVQEVAYEVAFRADDRPGFCSDGFHYVNGVSITTDDDEFPAGPEFCDVALGDALEDCDVEVLEAIFAGKPRTRSELLALVDAEPLPPIP